MTILRIWYPRRVLEAASLVLKDNYPATWMSLENACHVKEARHKGSHVILNFCGLCRMGRCHQGVSVVARSYGEGDSGLWWGFPWGDKNILELVGGVCVAL